MAAACLGVDTAAAAIMVGLRRNAGGLPLLVERPVRRQCSTGLGEARSGLRGGPSDGLEREVDDLGAVQLFTFADAGAELGAGQMVA